MKNYSNRNQTRIVVVLMLTVCLILTAVVPGALAQISDEDAQYHKVGFVDHSAYDKWSMWVGGDALLPELDKIDALVDKLSDGLYEEDTIMDATAKANPEVNASEKKALRTALYSFWNLADPNFFCLDTFKTSDYEVSVEYQESRNGSAGTWDVRLYPTPDSRFPYYYAEINAAENQLLRIHKLNEDGTKTLKIIYFGAVELDYDEFISMGQFG